MTYQVEYFDADQRRRVKAVETRNLELMPETVALGVLANAINSGASRRHEECRKVVKWWTVPAGKAVPGG
jgi:hypothetical protein